MSDLINFQEEAKRELENPEVFNALLKTTFKGLSEDNMRLAITDGIIRGFDFKDFRERNVYAIPFSNTYSLVTSIDYARKIGAKSGIVGKDEPIYGEDEDGNAYCTMVVRKRFPDGYVGEFKSKVYLTEFSTGKNLWTTKPRTMIAKVAEMHALRMACPEELAQAYTEEEVEKEAKPAAIVTDMAKYRAKLEAATTIEELGAIWPSLPPEAKKELEGLKDELKTKLAAEPTYAPDENA